MNLGHVAGNDDVAVAGGHREQVGGKLARQPDTAMGSGMVGHMALMQSNARPGEPLHVGHWRVGVDVGPVMAALFHHGEDALRRIVTRLAGGYAR